MTGGKKRIAEVLMHPNISDFCKDIITIGFTKDYDAAVADVEVALECLKVRREEALGTDWNKLKEETGPHLKCAVTTTISGHFAFGSGVLDEFGFWENPCYDCARDHEKRYPNDGACWPFKDV
jgi:hypothetical protein